MSTETEVKIRIDDAESFCSLLDALAPEAVSGRHFEDNLLLDFPDHRLRNSRSLLRVRFAGDDAFLTYKGPPRPEGIFKTREELEVRLDSANVAVQILEKTGMTVQFRYQKYRREYLVDGTYVAVDETPIGNYVELEGSEEQIRQLAGKLGIPESGFLRASYYTLYLEYCREKGVAPRFMVFRENRD